jgi:hypothetical protein
LTYPAGYLHPLRQIVPAGILAPPIVSLDESIPNTLSTTPFSQRLPLRPGSGFSGSRGARQAPLEIALDLGYQNAQPTDGPKPIRGEVCNNSV